MSDIKQVLGERIRFARKQLGLTQHDLAIILGFSAHQTIAAIESGKREIKAWELAYFARALHLDISELLAKSEPELKPAVLWRESPTQNKEDIEARFLKHCNDYFTLEQLAGEEGERDLLLIDKNKDIFNYSDAKELAQRIRTELDLGSRPADSLVGVLEDNFSVKIWYEDLEEEGSAASTRGSFGPAILMNSSEAPWRRNFNFAHELFHLLTWQVFTPQLLWDDEDQQKDVEKYANTFASSLLLPAESVTNAFQKHVRDDKVEYSAFINIAREFGVSTVALLWRAFDLRLIRDEETVERLKEDPAFRALDRSTMSSRWWNPPGIPERFVRLAFMAYQKGNLSRARLADYLNTSLLDLTDTLLEYGLDDREDYKTKVSVTRC